MENELRVLGRLGHEDGCLGHAEKGVGITVSQAAVLVPVSNVIKYPAWKIKVGF